MPETKDQLKARRKVILARRKALAKKNQRIRKRIQKIGVRVENLKHKIKHYRKPVELPDECWDSVNTPGIPAKAAHKAVGSYGAGPYANFAEARATFPDAKHVVFMPGVSYNITADILQHADAIILDIEPGDATPAEYAAWYAKWRPHFKGPLGQYSMRSEESQIPREEGDKNWLADPTGVGHSVAGFNAVQDIWTQNYDHSTLQPSLWT